MLRDEALVAPGRKQCRLIDEIGQIRA